MRACIYIKAGVRKRENADAGERGCGKRAKVADRAWRDTEGKRKEVKVMRAFARAFTYARADTPSLRQALERGDKYFSVLTFSILSARANERRRRLRLRSLSLFLTRERERFKKIGNARGYTWESRRERE